MHSFSPRTLGLISFESDSAMLKSLFFSSLKSISFGEVEYDKTCRGVVTFKFYEFSNDKLVFLLKFVNFGFVT